MFGEGYFGNFKISYLILIKLNGGLNLYGFVDPIYIYIYIKLKAQIEDFIKTEILPPGIYIYIHVYKYVA